MSANFEVTAAPVTGKRYTLDQVELCLATAEARIEQCRSAHTQAAKAARAAHQKLADGLAKWHESHHITPLQQARDFQRVGISERINPPVKPIEAPPISPLDAALRRMTAGRGGRGIRRGSIPRR